MWPNNKWTLITTILTIVATLLSQIYKRTKTTTLSHTLHLLQHIRWWRGIAVCHEKALMETLWHRMTAKFWTVCSVVLKKIWTHIYDNKEFKCATVCVNFPPRRRSMILTFVWSQYVIPPASLDYTACMRNFNLGDGMPYVAFVWLVSFGSHRLSLSLTWFTVSFWLCTLEHYCSQGPFRVSWVSCLCRAGRRRWCNQWKCNKFSPYDASVNILYQYYLTGGTRRVGIAITLLRSYTVVVVSSRVAFLISCRIICIF